MLTLITPGQSVAAPRTARAASPALRLFSRDMTALERAEDLLRSAEKASSETERFELTHRAALRAAGVLIARANRERRRPLPLNVWVALQRMGPQGRRIAEDFAPMVRERESLERSPHSRPQPELLDAQHRLTTDLLQSVREQLVEDLALPQIAG